MTQYIHVRNWDRFQHPDTKRGDRAVPWIKSYTQQLTELAYLELSYSERGLLESLRLQYASNRGAGIDLRPTVLNRLLGQPVRNVHIERLNHAGFIVISASKALAESLRDARLDKDKDKDRTLATPSPEDDSSSSSDAASSAGDQSSADDDIVVPSSSKPSAPRDEVWDELERLFGRVVDKTSAHGARNRAVKDLRAYGAGAELVRLAARRWASLYPSATLTDSALAKHWPQLTAGAARRGAPPCAECGTGGGFHAPDCPRLAERPPGELERFFQDQDDKEDVA